MTDFLTKSNILADLWINYRGDEQFDDFIEYNDIGLPLAYFISNDLVELKNPIADTYITETFDLLLAALDIKEDIGFDTLNEMLNYTI